MHRGYKVNTTLWSTALRQSENRQLRKLNRVYRMLKYHKSKSWCYKKGFCGHNGSGIVGKVRYEFKKL